MIQDSDSSSRMRMIMASPRPDAVGAGLLLRRQLPDQDRDEDDVVDAEHDLEGGEGQEGDPDRGVRHPLHAGSRGKAPRDRRTTTILRGPRSGPLQPIRSELEARRWARPLKLGRLAVAARSLRRSATHAVARIPAAADPGPVRVRLARVQRALAYQLILEMDLARDEWLGETRHSPAELLAIPDEDASQTREGRGVPGVPGRRDEASVRQGEDALFPVVPKQAQRQNIAAN